MKTLDIKTNLLSAGIVGVGIVASAFIVVNFAFAQVAEDAVQFPVAELGNCGNKEECKAYCDEPENMEACISFAEKNGLMPPEEIETAKKFLSAGAKGPGGCTGKESCQVYCDDIDHIDECVAFAERTGLLPPDELAEAKQVQSAIARGVKPPPCRGKESCDAYCENPDNMKECVAFGEASGFLEGKELEDAKKMMAAIEKGVKPPPCRGKEACDAYCSEPDNMEACMTFALEAGFMTEQEAQDSQKMLVALKKGVKPPPCRGKEECDAYCGDPAHSDECITFAVAAGFMSEKDAEMAKKTGGKGPGGCTSKESCDAYCAENQQACMDFAKENGMMSEEDAVRMQEGQQKFRESINQMPSEASECLRSALGDDSFEKIKNGEIMPSQAIGEQMQSCFSQMGPPEGMRPTENMGPPPEGWSEGQQPPEGMMRPPEGGEWQGQMPPEGMGPPPEGWPEGMQRPPEGWQPGMQPPEGWTGQTPPEGWTGQIPPEGMMSSGGGGGGAVPTEGMAPPSGGNWQMPPEGMIPPSESGSGGGGMYGEPMPAGEPVFAPSSESAPAPVESAPAPAPVETAPAPAPASETTAPQALKFDLRNVLANALQAIKEFAF